MISSRFIVGVLCLIGGWSSAGTVRGAVLINELMYHPASENSLEEYIELRNTGPTNVNLAGWRFTKGIQFTFTNASMPAGGYLVVAANAPVFAGKYPSVTNFVGGWAGQLSNSGEDVRLEDAASNRVDSVHYADEGDWAQRQHRAADTWGQRGWIWYAGHDGHGRSLERITAADSDVGQNWTSSITTNGTPGQANSVAQTNIAPFILDVQHLPPVPRSIDAVFVAARLWDERGSNISATLFWRLDGAAGFNSTAMYDDGLHDDGTAGDGIFAAVIPSQTNNAVVEFYVRATDVDGNARTWPGPAIEMNGDAMGQVCNALYQVDDSTFNGTAPLYKIIMIETERANLEHIMTNSYPGEAASDAEMNATFISIDASGAETRYTTGARNRGHWTRSSQPNNFRVQFPDDRPWKGVPALNINGQYTHLQILGSVMCLKSGLIAASSRPVQLRVNNANLANNGPQTYGGMYAANEVVNSDWAEHWFPDDSSGNLYRVIRDDPPPNFNYRGTNPPAYMNTYFKESNVSENDWTDLIGMLEVLGENQTTNFTVARARAVADVEQWLLHIAVLNLLGDYESGLTTGYNDDYLLYAGKLDPRFRLVPYDLDSLLGQGGDDPRVFPANESIFQATLRPSTGDEGSWRAMNWLMHRPEFEPVYYRTLRHLLDTTFSESEFNTTVDQTLGGFVPGTTNTALKTWMSARRNYVAGIVDPYLATNPVPVVATVRGEPRSSTPLTAATLTVGGSGVVSYRFSVNGGAFGATNSVSVPIVLSNLSPGSTNSVRVIGVGTNGMWQSALEATVSREWVVNTSWPGVRINEVLAANTAAFNHSGTFPDAIELYNESSVTADLSGMRLTDKFTSPNKYTFPNGTTLAAGGCLVVLANNSDGTPGIHLGFSLAQEGEGVYLFDKAANGGALLDAVEFGSQLADYSIGRAGDDAEFVLMQPTLGATNTALPMGDVEHLRINEYLASELALFPTDFVELYNPDSLPVALGGLYLTDNPIGEPRKHAIAPLTFISSGGYCVFKADGDPEQGLDHLTFKLASEQGLIALLDADLDMIDCIPYGPQRTDVSQGRSPDGSGRILSLVQPTPGAPNPSGVPVTRTLIEFTNSWRFNQSSNLNGVNWTAPGYGDASWPQGAGLLYHEEVALPVPANTWLSLTNPSGSPVITYYFRSHFTFPNPPAGAALQLWTVLDDGAVFYLNGQRLYSIRLPSTGTILYTNLAETVLDAVVEGPFSVPTTALVQGDNVLAVEVHQSSSSSSDVVFGMQLDATVYFWTGINLVLNEIAANNESFTNAAGRTPDWIEIYNGGTNTADLSGMSLSDDPIVPRKWIFPPGSSIDAGTNLVIECDDGLPASATNTGFALNAAGETVYLFASPSAGGSVVDAVSFGLQAPDLSVGRMPNGVGAWALTLPTRESANVAAGTGNASAIRINEWMAAVTGEDDWLELYNPNAQPVELAGLALTDNPSMRDKSRFPPLSFLGPGECRQLIADGTVGAADHVNFKLDAGGSFVGLNWPIGTQIDALSFGPQVADVSQGRFPDGTATVVDFPGSASPGEPNYRLLSGLVISEVLTHTDPPLEDAIEIQNVGSNAIDLGGWYLSNTARDLGKYRIPVDTVVTGGGFAVFYEYQFGTNTSTNALRPFNFNSAHGDEAHLSETDAGGNLTGYRARVTFGAAANGVSFGRFQTSIGEEFVPLGSRSFGMDEPDTLTEFRTGTGLSNSSPLIGPVVINEIHFRATNNYAGNLEAGQFIELVNRTAGPVPLYDPAAATNTWQVADDVNFIFPTNVVLAAGRAVVLVNFDPVAAPAESNWFCSLYSVPAGTRLFGPWSGTLDSEGGEIRLIRPDPPQLAPHPDAGFVPGILVEHIHPNAVAPWPATRSCDSLQRVAAGDFGNEPLNWFAAAPSPGRDNSQDTDGDGLPDYWEIAGGLDPADAAGVNGAAGDLDGDGQNNLREFLAGTQPNDAADLFRVRSVTRSTDLVRLQFHLGARRTCSVLRADSPAGPWSKLADAPVSANPAEIEVTDTIATRRFYRLVTPSVP